MDGRSGSRRGIARVALAALLALASTGLVPVAAAHAGSVHAGTPHWVLLGVLALGVGVVAGGLWLGRGPWADRKRLVAASALLGAGLATLAVVGLTDLQVEPLSTDATPIPRAWYDLAALWTGGTLVAGSLAVGLRRWPDRPEYATLGVVLGSWVGYPALVPSPADYWHPVGYLLVLVVPPLVGYVVWRDVRPALAAVGRPSWRVGSAVGALFLVFYLFSSGQFTLNPAEGAGGADEAFFVTAEFANPLVVWPAVEFYLPSLPLVGIPFFGALSVGTVLTFLVLSGLVGVNAVLGAELRRRELSAGGSRSVAGGLAATGATACCCCAPAAYGVVSAVAGLSASPLYWVFTDPASPLGTLFFALTTLLMTASAVHFAGTLRRSGACEIRGQGRSGEEPGPGTA